MEKSNKSVNPPKHVMATILMPIEIRNLEKDEYVCLQNRARVSLAFCQDLPDIAAEGEGYGGLSEKIHHLYDSWDVSLEKGVAGEEVKTGEKTEEKKGEIESSPPFSDLKKKPTSESSDKTEKNTRRKHNITYRHFRENIASHRYTSKNWD